MFCIPSSLKKGRALGPQPVGGFVVLLSRLLKGPLHGGQTDMLEEFRVYRAYRVFWVFRVLRV